LRHVFGASRLVPEPGELRAALHLLAGVGDDPARFQSATHN
jgi:hypothetical protein